VDALFEEYGSDVLSILTEERENLVVWAMKKSAWSCLYVILQNGTPQLLELSSPNGEVKL